MTDIVSTVILAVAALAVIVLPASVVATRTETDRAPGDATVPEQRDGEVGDA